MTSTLWLILYCVLVAFAALLGGAIPMMIRLTHRRMQVATSLIGGFMLGVALLHLLPHAAMAVPIASAMVWTVAGLLTMFFLERFFSYHHHTAPGEADHPPVTADPEPAVACQSPGNPIDHTHGHAHAHQAPWPRHGRHVAMSWAGVGVGLAIHSLINGGALAAAVAVETHATEGTGLWLPGVAVFLVVALHKPFDSMTLLTLMTTSGASRRAKVLANLAYACCVPAGALLFMLGLKGLDLHTSTALGYALAFTAGMFLCVSLADLLPELQFHQHDKGLLSAAMVLGLVLAWGIHVLESTVHHHHHGPDHGGSCPHDHDHSHRH